MMQVTLQEAGYHVETAAGGEHAVRANRRMPADLAIIDLIMPDKEGLETIREFRSESPATKIIAITGGGTVGTGKYLDLARAFGADCGLPKPIGREDLLFAVRQVCDGTDEDLGGSTRARP